MFVVQSGPFMTDTAAVNEIGDYAVAKGLHFAVFYDTPVVSSGGDVAGQCYAAVGRYVWRRLLR